MKVLVAGWFSFEEMGATVGDILSKDLVCEWLAHAGRDFDVALADPFLGGIDWRKVDPKNYSHVVFVCGPFGNGWPITEFLPRFKGCRLIGLNLSMLEPLDVWNPFDLLFERDSSEGANPDITFLSHQPKVPVVGVVLVHPQKEYGKNAMHEVANKAVRQLMNSREMSVVHIDTRLDINSTGLRSAAEVESLFSRMDVVLTTRLHGLVLALKNGVPVIALDPIAGGAKISHQAHTIGWPIVFTADKVTDQSLQEAFNYCLTAEARERARAYGEKARMKAALLRDRFISALSEMAKARGV